MELTSFFEGLWILLSQVIPGIIGMIVSANWTIAKMAYEFLVYGMRNIVKYAPRREVSFGSLIQMDKIPVRSLLIVPGILIIGHYILYYIMHKVMKIRGQFPADRLLWASVSIGSALASLYIFRLTLPLGKIGPELLDEVIWNSERLQQTCTSFLSQTVFFYIYHIISNITSVASSPMYKTRKTIPVFAIICMMLTPEVITKPSNIIRLVAWLLRYLVVDALCDFVFLLHAMENSYVSRQRRKHEYGIESSMMILHIIVIAAWLGLIWQMYDVYELHNTVLTRFAATWWISGFMLLAALNFIELDRKN